MEKRDAHYKKEERPWGTRLEFARNEECTVVLIQANPGESLSKQYHHDREEYWYVTKGSGTVVIEDIEYKALPGDRFFAPKGGNHRISAGENEGIEILEVSKGRYEDEDIVRLEDKYGRSGS
jgi:mannose-6-phosphate isomerase-like protein (cupin superfamily)